MLINDKRHKFTVNEELLNRVREMKNMAIDLELEIMRANQVSNHAATTTHPSGKRVIKSDIINTIKKHPHIAETLAEYFGVKRSSFILGLINAYPKYTDSVNLESKVIEVLSLPVGSTIYEFAK